MIESVVAIQRLELSAYFFMQTNFNYYYRRQKLGN